MKITYVACNEKGVILNGKLTVSSAAQAKQQLHKRGLYVIHLKEAGHLRNTVRNIPYRLLTRNAKLGFLSRFTLHLSLLYRAGLPLLTSLEIITQDTTEHIFNQALSQLQFDISEGLSLANALSKQAILFPMVLTGMTTAAETTGRLDTVYEHLHTLFDKELEVRNRIVEASTYPLILLMLVFVGIYGVSKLVLPQWIQILSDVETRLPWATRLLLSMGNLTLLDGDKIGRYLCGIALLCTVLGLLLRKCPSWSKLKIPIVHDLQIRYQWARISYLLGLSLSCGVSLLTGLDIALKTTHSPIVASELKKIIIGIRSGADLTTQLRSSDSAPALLIPLVNTAERTGHMGAAFVQAATILYKDLDLIINKIIKWVEPALIIIMGLVVGFVVMALMLPMFALMDYI